jgi:hypothetical protein
MGSFIDITGQRFGRLVVTRRAPNKGKSTAWLCRCDCGKNTEVFGVNLKRGFTVSCGCFRKEYERQADHARPVHGHASGGKRSPTYVAYTGMIQRTTDSTSPSWSNYGGRGITTCDRWLKGDADRRGFECFLSDMGERPAGLTLDRIDNFGNYEPTNCRWADLHTQAVNRRTTKLSEADVTELRRSAHEGYSRRELAARFNVNPKYVGQVVSGYRRAQG